MTERTLLDHAYLVSFVLRKMGFRNPAQQVFLRRCLQPRSGGPYDGKGLCSCHPQGHKHSDAQRPCPANSCPTMDENTLTRRGYAALGVADGGWLAPGNKADLIMLDLRRPHLVPLLRAVSCIMHQGQARDVEAVMVDGRWVMRDWTLLTMDEAAIVQEADRIGRAAWQRLFTERPSLIPPSGFR